MFTGTYENSIDGKNRIIIPAKHREQLGEKCILTKGLYDYCLYIYSTEEWNNLINKIKLLPQSNSSVREFMREIFPNTEECKMDSQGRILIPQNLRDYAGINKELVTIGVMDKIEIWDKERFETKDGQNAVQDERFLELLRQYEL